MHTAKILDATHKCLQVHELKTTVFATSQLSFLAAGLCIAHEKSCEAALLSSMSMTSVVAHRASDSPEPYHSVRVDASHIDIHIQDGHQIIKDAQR